MSPAANVFRVCVLCYWLVPVEEDHDYDLPGYTRHHISVDDRRLLRAAVSAAALPVSVTTTSVGVEEDASV